MSHTLASPIRWNVFARELADVLAAHGLRLGHLDDRWDEQGRLVHPEKVRRLQQSLQSPKCLAMLSPDELERVAAAFDLTERELQRLRVAVLATSVEATLLDRIPPQHALLAADEVFQVVLTALDASQDSSGLAKVRTPTEVSYHQIARSTDLMSGCDATFLEALDLIDRASLALHLSVQETPVPERLAQTWRAYDSATRAQRLLKRSQCPDHDQPEWRFWQETAQHAARVAAEQMRASLASERSGASMIETVGDPETTVP